MTEPILGAKFEQPTICGCCARLASPVGVLSPDPYILWLCEFCYPNTGMKVTAMNPMKLVELETAAIDKAASSTIDDVVAAIFDTLWTNNIRDLEALNGDNFPAIKAQIASLPEYRSAMHKLLIEYSNNVRLSLTTAN